MLSKLVKYKQAKGKERKEKVVRDVVRLEIAALLGLTREGHTDFMAEIFHRATPEQRGWIKDELKKIEKMLRIKVEALDEA